MSERLCDLRGDDRIVAVGEERDLKVQRQGTESGARAINVLDPGLRRVPPAHGLRRVLAPGLRRVLASSVLAHGVLGPGVLGHGGWAPGLSRVSHACCALLVGVQPCHPILCAYCYCFTGSFALLYPGAGQGRGFG
jgi:hypothetical protein